MARLALLLAEAAFQSWHLIKRCALDVSGDEADGWGGVAP
jgi:hypothetical protein